MIIKTKKSGFTLIEILIAAAIFALVMVIVAGIFSWAAAYNGKLHQMRVVSQNSRKITTDISTNVRLANGSLGVVDSHNPNASIQVDELAIIQCGIFLGPCNVYEPEIQGTQPVEEGIDTPIKDTHLLGLLIVNKTANQAIVYMTSKISDPDNYQLSEDIYDISSLTGALNIWIPSSNHVVLNSPDISFYVQFGGYTPWREPTVPQSQYIYYFGQPFVTVRTISKTVNYDNQSPTSRAKTEIRTVVESRYYKEFQVPSS